MLKIYRAKAPDLSRESEKLYTERLIGHIFDDLKINGCALNKLPSGKPYISGSDLKVSITHKDGNIFIAICDKNIGIDVEKISDDNEKLAKRIMSEEMFEEYLASKDRAVFLYSFYSAKEAYAKFLGKGLSVVMKKDIAVPYTYQKTVLLDGIGYLFSLYCEKAKDISDIEFVFADFSLKD